MARYIVAVSGGVDSVVLLHMLQGLKTHELIVAHVDHGIRPDSAKDAAFVKALAEQYGLPFRVRTHALGAEASEEQARNIRYAFLRELADEFDARIMTAHHADDIVESIAINLKRGTGWRGLATHDSDIVRPLTSYSKKQLYSYAQKRALEWREDSTNQSDLYLRNRFRKQLAVLSDDSRRTFLELRQRQIALKNDIEDEIIQLIGVGPSYERHFFIHVPSRLGVECLRVATEGKLTRPQLQKLLLAVKTTAQGKTIEAGSGVSVQFSTRNFSLSLIK